MTGWTVDEYAVRDLLDAAPVGVTIHAPDGPAVYANDRFLSFSGYDREAVLGSAVDLLAGPETDERQRRRVDRVLDADGPVTVLFRAQRADDSTFWNRLRAAPLPDGYTLLLHEAVAEHRDPETTLEALEAHASRVDEATTLREVCHCTAVAAAELFAATYCVVAVREGEWPVPRGATGDVPPDLSRQLHLGVGVPGEVFRSGESRRLVDTDDLLDSVTGAARSGLVVPVGDRGVLLLAAAEPAAVDERDVAPAELLATQAAVAISRLERDRDLQQRTERLATFADVVSDDLRNPLAVLDGALELAHETGDDDHFERARRAVDRMGAIVGSLREQAHHGDGVGGLETVDLVAVSEACWRSVVTDGAELSVQTDRRIRADPDRLEQLLETLFRNAVEHGDAWHVTLGELPDDDGFFVRDDGGGIPESERGAVFESGYTTAEDGTGFGLPICQQIADFHGWELAVGESRNGGARFEIRGVELVRD